MLDIILIIIGGLCLLAGFLGCVLPALPGPPVSFIGLVLLHLTEKVQFSTAELVIWLLLVVVIQVVDQLIPMQGAKYFKGSRWGTWGAFAGSVLGLFFLPWGILLGPFLGAVAGEILGRRTMTQALKSGAGSLLGFLFGTVLKLILCGYFIVRFFTAILT